MSILEDGRKEAAFLIEKSFPYVIETMSDLSCTLQDKTVGQRMIMAEGRMSNGDNYSDLYIARAYGIIVENLISSLRDENNKKLDYSEIFYPASWQMPNFPKIIASVPDTGDPLEDGTKAFADLALDSTAGQHGLSVGYIVLIGELSRYGLMSFVIPKQYIGNIENSIKEYKQNDIITPLKNIFLDLMGYTDAASYYSDLNRIKMENSKTSISISDV